jgi:hypothetical protein
MAAFARPVRIDDKFCTTDPTDFPILSSPSISYSSTDSKAAIFKSTLLLLLLLTGVVAHAPRRKATDEDDDTVENASDVAAMAAITHAIPITLIMSN